MAVGCDSDDVTLVAAQHGATHRGMFGDFSRAGISLVRWDDLDAKLIWRLGRVVERMQGEMVIKQDGGHKEEGGGEDKTSPWPR